MIESEHTAVALCTVLALHVAVGVAHDTEQVVLPRVEWLPMRSLKHIRELLLAAEGVLMQNHRVGGVAECRSYREPDHTNRKPANRDAKEHLQNLNCSLEAKRLAYD